MMRLAASLIAVASPLLSAQPFDTPPPVGAPRPVVIAAPSVSTLPNGLRVVVAQRTGLPLVTAQLVIRSGAETDPPQQAGLADVTATLLTKGTAKRSAPQIAEAAEALGSPIESGAGWDRSFVSMTVTLPQLPAALALIAEVALQPRFDGAELARARRLAQDGLSVAMRDPGSLARMAADRAAFGAGAYGHAAVGTPASLARLRRGDVVAQHARWYRPDNATLIFAGDIDAKDAVVLARSAFGAWRRPSAPLPPARIDDTQTGTLAPVAIAMPGVGQAGVALVAPTIARAAPDYYPGLVANTLLGGGYSARLNQELRIKRGLTYGIGSRLDARRSGGVWSITAQTKNESVPELIVVALDEIKRVAATPAPADELEARKLSIIGSVSRRFETTEDLAATLASLEANGIAVVELTRAIDRIAAVTPQQVLEFAQAHWRTGALALVVAGDAEKFAAALRAMHPDLRVISHTDIDLDRPALVKAR
jgi:zinc protease